MVHIHGGVQYIYCFVFGDWKVRGGYVPFVPFAVRSRVLFLHALFDYGSVSWCQTGLSLLAVRFPAGSRLMKEFWASSPLSG